MKTKQLTGAKARKVLFEGVDKVYQAVAPTLGSKGRNVVYRKWGRPHITNDGVSIGRQVNPEDPFEALGADLIKQAAEEVNEEVGDGTTTVTILTHDIIEEGLKSSDPNRLKAELHEAGEKIIEEIGNRSIKLNENSPELLQIANISVEDKNIAKTVVDAVVAAGVNGRIVVQHKGDKVKHEVIPGLELADGYSSPYMATNEKGECVLENVLVYVSDKTYQLNKDIIPVLNTAIANGQKAIVLIGKELKAEALSSVIQNNVDGRFFTCFIPFSGTKEQLEDIALYTGATTDTVEKQIKDITPGYFGRAKSAVITDKKTLLIAATRDDLSEKKFKDRIEGLKSQIKDTKIEKEEKQKVKESLAWLSNSIVLIKIGAPVDAEVTYIKDKVDDAVSSAQSALEDGYVLGGGVTIKEASAKVHSELNTEGSRILAQACAKPFEQLRNSYGLTDTDYLKGLKEVIDPTKVEKSALKKAVSLAKMFITLETAIVEIKDTK